MNANTNNHANGTKTSELSFDEAPASWNTRYLDPNGFECQITLRGESGSELHRGRSAGDLRSGDLGGDVDAKVARGI